MMAAYAEKHARRTPPSQCPMFRLNLSNLAETADGRPCGGSGRGAVGIC